MHGLFFCGGSGIRTHGPLSRTPVFKTGAFDHSAIPPVYSGNPTVYTRMRKCVLLLSDILILMEERILEWKAREITGRRRGPDWYWILGIVAVTMGLLAILFGNILFAVVIIVGTFAIILSVAREHEEHHFKLSDDGLQIGSHLYPFENMESFSIVEYIDPEVSPTLSIQTTSILAPHLLISLENVDPVEVYEILDDHIDMEEHRDTIIDRAVDFLGL